MPLIPDPETGLVIRYSYLWRHEAETGVEEGRKDRPCAIVLAHRREENGETVVLVAPITHTKPVFDPNAIELPMEVKRRLGLDDERSWIVTNDLNSFIWPGPDLRPTGSRTSDSIAYGFLPANLTRDLIQRIRTLMQTKQVRPVQRTE